MRAPSTDLLRALRRAASTTSSSIQATRSHTCSTRTVCMPRQRDPTRFLRLPSLYRPFSTTSPSHQQSSSSRGPLGPPSSRSSPSNPARPGSPRQNPYAPSRNKDRGPASKEETQTDFSKLDIYASAGVEEPATSIDACTRDGFHLNNGVVTSGGRGVMLVGGEGFVWSPWNMVQATSASSSLSSQDRQPFSQFLDARSVLSFPSSSFGLLTLLYPKPDLLIFGTGRRLHMLSKETRRYLSEELGIKVDVMDTPNAAAAYNLLVMERGVEGVGAVLIPEGFGGR